MDGRIYCEQEVRVSKTAASDDFSGSGDGAAAILTNILRYFEFNFFKMKYQFHVLRYSFSIKAQK